MGTLLPQLRSEEVVRAKTPPQYDILPPSLFREIIALWQAGNDTKEIAEVLGAENDAIYRESDILTAVTHRPKARAAA